MIGHPLPEPPLPSKAEDELVELLGDFNWATDTVERCTRVIKNENASETEVYEAVWELKHLLCTSRDHVFPIAQDVINTGVLGSLVRLVETASDQIKLPAAFCLTNIAAGSDEQTATIVEQGAVPAMLKLLRSSAESLRRQAMFCLANVAGSTPENRLMLADRPEYVDALGYDIVLSGDYRIEELAVWNLRNLIVLGGVPLEKCLPALNVFVQQIHTSTPPTQTIATLITNGSATLTSLECSSPSWFKFGPADLHQTSAVFGGVFPTLKYNKPALRFAAEAFSSVSRHQAGPDYLLQNDLEMKLLFLAKFHANASVRNYMLETLVNLTARGPCERMFTAVTIAGLGEIICDFFSYSPHQRVLAAQALWHLIRHSHKDTALFVAKNIVTRGSVLTLLDSLAMRIETTGDNAVDMSMLDQVDSKYMTESLLEVAIRIYTQDFILEEIALREKCARIVVAVLQGLGPAELGELLSARLLSLLLEIANFAAQIDSLSEQSGERFASVQEALVIGEPAAPRPFLLEVWTLMEKLHQVGESIRQQTGAVINPVVLYFHRLEHQASLREIIATSSLSLDLIDQAESALTRMLAF